MRLFRKKSYCSHGKSVGAAVIVAELKPISLLHDNFMNSMERTMKPRNTIAKTFSIAALTALVLSIAPTATAADKGCSNASLTGTFVRRDTGTILSPATIAGPIAVVGTFTFDGNGSLTGAGVQSQNGNISHGTSTGTYTVNPDCSGTIINQGSGGHSSHYSFWMDNNGNEIQYICTDTAPGFAIVYSGFARRQFPWGDPRQ